MLIPAALIGSERSDADADVLVRVEIRQKLGNYPKANKDPVRLLVIGSRPAIQVIVQHLLLFGFAEIFDWTDFKPAPTSERPLRCNPDESMKMLVRYFPQS